MSTLSGILSLQHKMDTKFQSMQNFLTRFLQLLLLYEKNHLNLATNAQLQFSYYHYGLNLDHCKIKNNAYGIIKMSNHSRLPSFLVLHNYHVPVV